MTNHHRIVIETGKKKTFASAIDWPGWCRWGKVGEDVLSTLRSYTDRYQRIAEIAGVRGVQATANEMQVIETIKGGATTDFGAPSKPATAESEFLTDAECERQIKLLRACWTYFDATIPLVSEELQKGPRGGGRDRDKIVSHVRESERSYVRNLGINFSKEDILAPEGIVTFRDAVCDAIREHNANTSHAKSWPLRYAIRSIAWHVTDHAWEMEDKDLSGKENRE